VLVLLLPPSFILQVREALADLVAAQPLSVLILAAFVMLCLLVALGVGSRWSASVARGALWGLPWLDALSYLMIAMVTVAVERGNNPSLFILGVPTMVLATIIQVLYNSVKFTKSPKSSDLFQRREAHISIVVNALHIIFISFVISRWAKGYAFTSSEKIAFSVLQLMFSIAKFSKSCLMQRNRS
jgi:hypothetical protein